MARRRITKAVIDFISLVPRGANKMPVIYKADDSTLELATLFKASDRFDDNGEVTAIVYAPEKVDSQGDIASAEVIKDAAHEFMRRGGGIDIRHDGVKLDKTKAFVAESFIVQKNDPRFEGVKDYDGNPVDVTGAWASVLKIEDPDLRKRYRDGNWNGVSMGGKAVVEAIKGDDIAERAITKLAELLGITTTQKETDMDANELKKALEANNTTLVAAITAGMTGVAKEIATALKGEVKTDQPAKKTEADLEKEARAKANPKPIMKGSWNNPEDVEAHQKKIELWKMRNDMDPEDPESVAEYQQKLAEFIEANGPSEEAKKSAGRASSGQASNGAGDAGGDNKSKGPRLVGLDKGDGSDDETDVQKALDAGSRMAKLANANRGYATA